MSFFKKIIDRFKKYTDQDNHSSMNAPEKAAPAEEMPSLRELIGRGDIDALTGRITEQNVNAEDENLLYPLHHAVTLNRDAVVAYLFSLGAKINTAGENQFDNPIKVIIASGNPKILRAFMENGFILPRLNGTTPLIHSALDATCSLEFLKALMDNGAELETHEDETALQKAIRINAGLDVILYLMDLDNQNFDLLKKEPLLLEDTIKASMDSLKKIKVIKALIQKKGLDINGKTGDGEEPILALAVRLKQTLVAKELILMGADFSSMVHQITSLFEQGDLEEIAGAAQSNSTDPVAFFAMFTHEKIVALINGCESLKGTCAVLGIVDNPKLSPDQKMALIQLAVEKGADVNEKSKKTTALLNLCRNALAEENADLTSCLLARGAKVEACNQSALFYAARIPNTNFVRLLLENGANVNYQDRHEKSLADYLVENGESYTDQARRIEVLKLAQNFGLDINTRSRHLVDEEACRMDMLSVFICEKRRDIIRFLVDHALEHAFKIDKSSPSVYYAVRFFIDLELSKKIVTLNPGYTYHEFYKEQGGPDDAQAIGIAVFFKNELLVEYLLGEYPEMKAHSRVKPITLDLVESDFKVETIKRLLLRDPDLNRRYVYDSGSGPYSISHVIGYAKRIAGNKHGNKEKYFQILEFLLQNGADPNVSEDHYGDQADSLSVFAVTAGEQKVDERLFDLLIRYGADPRQTLPPMDESAIHTIVQRLPGLTDASIVSHLEYFWNKTGIDLAQTNNLGVSLLMAAAMNCKPKAVQWLISKGADITAAGGHYNAPVLHKAISTYGNREAGQRAETVRILIENGADSNGCTGDGTTPLMAACYYGAFLCVKILLEKGADVHQKNHTHATAINYAVDGNFSYDYNAPTAMESVKSRIIQRLYACGADMNTLADDAPGALITAIGQNKKEIYDTLLKVKADVNRADKYGITPLMHAVWQGNIFFVNKLLDHGDTDIQRREVHNGTALYFTIYRGNETEGIRLFNQLIHEGIEETQLESGDTLLHRACYLGNHKIIPAILQHTRFNINTRNQHGMTALSTVIASDADISPSLRMTIAKLLIQNGADPDIEDNDGNLPLTYAVRMKNRMMVQSLVELGAAVNIQARGGVTLFHLLLDQGFSPSELDFYLALFTQNGADINHGPDPCLLYFVRNMEFAASRSIGFVPKENKVKKAEGDVVDLLIRYGADVQLALKSAEDQNLPGDILGYLVNFIKKSE
jgi:ankyrin repeat protein